MTDETFPHEIWADLDHWIEGPAASDLRAQGYMKYIRADRIEELEAKLAKAVEERDEALNQLDSAKHSVAVLEKRVKTFCDGWGVADKGRIEAETKLAKAVDGLRQCEAEIDDYIRHEYPGDHPVQSRYRKRDFDANPARTTLAELTGGKDE